MGNTESRDLSTTELKESARESRREKERTKMSALKKMIKQASSHKRKELDENTARNGVDGEEGEEESEAYKLLTEVLALGGLGAWVDLKDEKLAGAVLQWAVEHDDLPLVRLMLEHVTPTTSPEIVHMKRLVARLASTDGTEPVLFLPDRADSDAEEEARRSQVGISIQPGSEMVGGSDKGQWQVAGPQSKVFNGLMWVGIAVQFIYIVLVLLQVSDVVRPIFAPAVMTV